MAFSNLKASLANREYKTFRDFVRGCALIWHNAHTYNRPDAGAYQDASTIKGLMEQEFQKLVDSNVVSAAEVAWPDLGEIPPVEDIPEEEEEAADEEDDEEDEEEGEDSDEEEVPKKRRPGRPSAASKKAETQRGDTIGQKRRGRPPKVDTPMVARMKNILKGLRKFRDENENQLIRHFEKLPDKVTMPEYFSEIKSPMSIEMLKRNIKRNHYRSVDHFMAHVDMMFNNAKEYNEDGSEIFEDASTLQAEAHKLAEIEKNKPDSDISLGDGRDARPEGIVHNGEHWKVGDWVHIQNANDVTKPIVAQIFKMWVKDGQEWINACWYYRPEQTVHQYERHFFPNEVVKSGQYRDHPIEDVIGRCFVMFYTRFHRGRPRGIPIDREVYVCEARYGEEKNSFNKIKTWSMCLPEAVRESDYEMDMFETQRKIKKIPSPLLHMVKDDAKESSEIPKPRWGAENAPPIVGGIYKGPRDKHVSIPNTLSFTTADR